MGFKFKFEFMLLELLLLDLFISWICLSEGLKYTNPVYNTDFPDPFCLVQNGIYYAYATNSGGFNIPCMKSTTPASWSNPKECLTQLPPWTVKGLTWAPSIYAVNDTFYVMYYTTRHPSTNQQAISVATSHSPEGPFEDHSKGPFIFQGNLGGSIDPSPIVDSDGKVYLVWKNDGNNNGLSTGIWSQELRKDGLSLMGNPTQLIKDEFKWEKGIVEGPTMRKYGNSYILLYSAGDYDSYIYCVGFARCSTPKGPCQKGNDSPVLSFFSNAWGPGGTEFFQMNGTWWVIYHSWTAPKDNYGDGGHRSLRIDPVKFETRNGQIFPVITATDWEQNV